MKGISPEVLQNLHHIMTLQRDLHSLVKVELFMQ